MGRVFIEYLEGRSYSCRCCGAQLALADCLLSKVNGSSSRCQREGYSSDYAAHWAFSTLDHTSNACSCRLAACGARRPRSLDHISSSPASLAVQPQMSKTSCSCQMGRQMGPNTPVFPAVVLQQFHSKNGPAWLFQACVNVLSGPKEERLMTTGMHVVADISCAKCLNVVGWKYVSVTHELLRLPHPRAHPPSPRRQRLHHEASPKSFTHGSLAPRFLPALSSCIPAAAAAAQEAAAEESQKYKEGKFILERCHVVESDSNSNMSPPRAFRHPFSYPMRSSDTSESDSY